MRYGILLTASDGVQYLYDALNQRVNKVGGTNRGDTIYFGGRPIALYSTSSDTWTDLIWAGNRMFAEVAGTQTAVPVYRLLNHLGSLVMTTDGSGHVTGTNLMTPYGETLSSTTSDSFQFAGLTQDPEYGGDHAMFRNYSTEQTRWLRPDPYNGSYDLTNPQSFNRYMYVNGNPLAFTDPSGRDPFTLTVISICGGFPGACAGIGIDPITAAIFGGVIGVAELGDLLGWCGGPQFNGNVQASQSGKNVPKNPCAYMGTAMPPSAYAAQGAASNIYKNPLGFGADAAKGWTGFLNSQPLNSGTVEQNAAYGNYVYGVYMQSAGLTLTQALFGANAFAAYRKLFNPQQYVNQQMNLNYPSLPNHNVANITNGYNAQAKGTTCHD